MFLGLRDLRGQHEGIVVDACTTELVTRLGQAHDHRPAPVQTDTHDLPAVVRCLHGVASLTVRSVSIPSIPPGVTRSEALLLHAIRRANSRGGRPGGEEAEKSQQAADRRWGPMPLPGSWRLILQSLDGPQEVVPQDSGLPFAVCRRGPCVFLAVARQHCRDMEEGVLAKSTAGSAHIASPSRRCR
jgi:hypothetical protein